MKNTSFIPFDNVFIEYIKNDKKNNMNSQHYHDSYEIYLQMSGRRYLFYDDICHNILPHDLVIFKPFDIHYTESRDIDFYERYVVNFKSEVLKCFLTDAELNILFEKLNSGVIHLDNNSYRQVYTCFTQTDEYSRRHGFLSEKLMYSAIFQLVTLVSELNKQDSTDDNSKIPYEIRCAIHYINTHYAENITLDAVSETVHMSKYHFCRMFHYATGATFTEYLSNVRLTKVHMFMTKTKLSLAEIAEKTGFSSAANLSRVFKNTYKLSPREFRKTI